MTVQCAKCGSSRIISEAKIFDQGQYSDGTLKAAFDKNPDAWIFKGTVLSKLRAVICGVCGFTELYVEEPGRLYDAFRPSESTDTHDDVCLQCGAEMPVDGPTCPACGWTYEGDSTR